MGKPLFERVNEHLAWRGLKVAGGTIVDATIISAPLRPRTARASAIRRCIKPKKATSGFSA